jgi:hypothetical protein
MMTDLKEILQNRSDNFEAGMKKVFDLICVQKGNSKVWSEVKVVFKQNNHLPEYDFIFAYYTKGWGALSHQPNCLNHLNSSH